MRENRWIRIPVPGVRLIVSACLLLACGAVAPMAAPASKEEVAVLTTPHGEIVWRFLDGDAPGHAAYVRDLIRRGFYDGTTFHRVIPHFVVQGGDPNSKNADRSDDGDGEADRRLKAEFSTTLHYRPGSVGMARDADPDSGSCQFFIALEDLPRLDEFLHLLPDQHGAAFEFRNDTWFADDVYDMLKAAGAALCLSEREDNAPPPLVETAAWGYIRLRLETYSDGDLKQWANRLAATAWREIHVYFMHEPTAPPYAQTLMRFWAT